MNRSILVIIIVILLVAAGFFFWHFQNDPQTITITDFKSCEEAGGVLIDGDPVKCQAPDGTIYEAENSAEPEVIVDMPAYGAVVTSPLKVTGRARGTWFFEANLPVTLKDSNGKVLAQKGFQAIGEWMTEDFVEFEGTLEFATPTTELGVLLIEKDNPSGLPEHDAAFAVPVRFK